MKGRILKNNLVVALVYAFAILFGLICNRFMFDPSQTATVTTINLTVILKESCEFLILLSLLINTRPRIWPAFYSIEMNEDSRDFIEELRFQENGGVNRPLMLGAPLADLCVASIHESSFDCISKDQSHPGYSFSQDSA